eukprot:9072231-Lingulodinium_polyedra.AAC.1
MRLEAYASVLVDPPSNLASTGPPDEQRRLRLARAEVHPEAVGRDGGVDALDGSLELAHDALRRLVLVEEERVVE